MLKNSNMFSKSKSDYTKIHYRRNDMNTSVLKPMFKFDKIYIKFFLILFYGMLVVISEDISYLIIYK